MFDLSVVTFALSLLLLIFFIVSLKHNKNIGLSWGIFPNEQAANASESSTLILQESCIDSSGSLVVYCPVDLHAINIVINGEDPSYIPLLPSGFAISPDGRPTDIKASTSAATGSEQSAGSLVTIVIQILVSNLPSAKLSSESLNTVTNLISNVVQQIKAAFKCSTNA